MKTKTGIEIITGRPKGMSFEEYKEKRSHSNAQLKERLRGFLCYLSVQITDGKDGQIMRKSYRPFIGQASKLKPL